MYLLTVCVSAFCAAACVSAVSDWEDGEVFDTSTGRYWLNRYYVNWTTAYQTCKERSSHLVVIDSQQEADNLDFLMNDNYEEYIPIGLSDKYQSGRYVSILDQDLSTMGYNTWREGFPDSNQGDCVALRRAPWAPGLCTVSCNKPMRSFCAERRGRSAEQDWIHYLGSGESLQQLGVSARLCVRSLGTLLGDQSN